ncbi:glycoside hydrolase family 15 protein [Devosia rhodophyticola]|uniref:Glycoside hydrolase family 15 protein n=1 Tax=Devosia rhodophyticola TaxID=3026423 RepID=A0ABY7YYM8_9HYPH|nr:glycoside hydrolase family 15 protein [Devosia rhodophyticola]WDR06479.1 glycoside hydrolase family 15 protein [Devosia rhodophyticola]
MNDQSKYNSIDWAPGQPGISPTWTSSAKDVVTTSLGSSRIWATLGYGIGNEVYWPSTGHPQIRDLGFIIAGPNGWTEVKRAQRYLISTPEPHVPLPRIVHEGDDYRLELEFLPHPLRDTLLVNYNLMGEGLQLYCLLAPHLDGERANNAWADGDLTAQRDAVSICLRSDCGFLRTSVGYAGESDGWQDFSRNGAMTWTYKCATDGNVAMTGELASASGTLALSFAQTLEGARTLARSSLAEDYDDVRHMFIDQWAQWGKTLVVPYASPEMTHVAETSATVIKVHEDRTYAGAVVASLSVPWGSSHDDAGGYHLVWTRDTVEAALAMIVIGQIEDAKRTLAYLIGTQSDDGGWAQNYFPDGRGYWTGNQLDEVALPVILAAKLRAVGNLNNSIPTENMVRSAIAFIVRNGPMSDQDRWEENAGASPFTLSLAICALVSSVDYFSAEEADYLLSLADCWNERIEDWTYTTDGEYCANRDIDGYYIRMSPRPRDGGIHGSIDVRNVAHGEIPATGLLGMEFLYLVRMGLRKADDKRIVDTVSLVDEELRVETPNGPSFHRYNGDGYGEHADGGPFDGQGVGRLWPLLTGERGHYAVAAGEDARPYLAAMAKMTGPGGLIPEQVWDRDALPDRGLSPGKPSGSAMPLVWAHGEFLKLLACITTKRPTELLDEVESRYGGNIPEAAVWHWREKSPFNSAPRDRDVNIEAAEPFVLHLTRDDWQNKEEIGSSPGAFGMHIVTLTNEQIADTGEMKFTFFYPDRKVWREKDFAIRFDR